MGKWQIVPISSFLQNRAGKYDPADTAIKSLRRLNKIDFDGNIHLSDKPTKTDMIIVQPGDLVISGINVAKGAIAVYEGADPITATIHYSSYTFDSKKINIHYFKRFLKSPSFIEALKEQVRGGIKTEIKAKDFLPIQIALPDIKEQQKINCHFDSFEQELQDLGKEQTCQSDYLSQLRQAILQEAIEGKLTADWRRKNPVKKGDPKSDAAALLEQIKTEKQKLIAEGKLKKEKPLAPIKLEDCPFEIPTGWVWCRLGEAALFERGKSRHRPRNAPHLYSDGTYPFVQTGEVAQSKHCGFEITSYAKCYNETGLAQSRLWPIGTLCITIAANIAETGFLGINACIPDSVVGVTSLTDASQLNFIQYYILWAKDEIGRIAPATAQKNINLGIISELLFPFPPLAEQQAIVERVERLLGSVEGLAQQVKARQTQADQLMQSVLREAFEQS